MRKDKRFKELGLREGDYVTREQVVTLLLVHPEVLDRIAGLRPPVLARR